MAKIILIIILLIGFGISCIFYSDAKKPVVSENSEVIASNQSQSTNFKGVSFQNKIPSVAGIATSEEDAVVLQNEMDKADAVKPRHLLFKFEGKNLDQYEDTGAPEINVYPIAEFRQVFAKSKELVKDFDQEINSLESIISGKTLKMQDFPLLVYTEWRPATISHFKHVSFKNGDGIVYITQFNIEEIIINNQRLKYTFQGITSDKRYYILATFPVKTSILPDSENAESFGDYKLPERFYDVKNYQENKRKYKQYLSSVESLLNKQNADDFNPGLTSIEETVSSLEVKWND